MFFLLPLNVLCWMSRWRRCDNQAKQQRKAY
nr:MAG TPA: hypothetical protein [Caudoviricetes sp.]